MQTNTFKTLPIPFGTLVVEVRNQLARCLDTLRGRQQRLLLLPLALGLCQWGAFGQVTFETIKSFGVPGPSGSGPVAGLSKGSDGAWYGTAKWGGPSGYGTVFKMNEDGSGFTVLHSFSGPDGKLPCAGLTKGSDGAWYSTTGGGGSYNYGTVFKIREDGSEFTVLHSFSIPDGAGPQASLSQGSDGACYGTTQWGGSSASGNSLGCGTVFKINEDGSGFAVLHSFSGPDGREPYASLSKGSDRAWYGTTTSGTTTGAGGFTYGTYGTVFKINEDGSGFAVLHTFSGPDGAAPCTSLSKGSDGAWYGTTRSGTYSDGSYFYGTVFKISEDGSGYAVLHRFSVHDAYPHASLSKGTDGAWYGTTDGFFGWDPTSGGTVFKINEDGSGYAVLHRFSGPDGAAPYTSLSQGSDGALYGTTFHGGSSDAGTVFKIKEDGSGFAVLRSFCEALQGNPWATLSQGRDGGWYATAVYGGFGNVWIGNNPFPSGTGNGMAFKIEQNGTGFTVLHGFDLVAGGPYASLHQGNDGAWYGTTVHGGTGHGTIFKLNEDGSGFTVLHKFSYSEGYFDEDGNWIPTPDLVAQSDGSSPYASLSQGSDGAWYGTACSGGSHNFGTVFRITSDGTGFDRLHCFSGSDGANPYAGLSKGSDGAWYGTTYAGGDTGYGTVFKINEDGSGFTVLHSFDGSGGGGPWAGLSMGADGSLYGTTYEGGSFDNGTVFEIKEDGSGFAVLHSFSGIDGANPYASLTKGGDGAMYGTTYGGGSSGDGTVFTIKEDGSDFAVLHSFDRAGGANPAASLSQGSDGAWYGTTSQGGDGNLGTIFRLSIKTSILSQLSPNSAQAGSGDLQLTIAGTGFAAGTIVLWNDTELVPLSLTDTAIEVAIPGFLLQTSADLETVSVRMKGPAGMISNAKAFTIIRAGSSVSAVDNAIVTAGEPVTVALPPVSETSGGVAAALSHDGEQPAAVSVAVYSSDPSPAAASFQTAGQFLDINVSGATANDRMAAYFYYPIGADPASLELKFYNQATAAWESVTPAVNDPVAHRFEVVFDANSHPAITELGGTFFAAAIPDRTPPTIVCPNITVSCSVDYLVPVIYPAPTALSDNVDQPSQITVSYSIPSGSGFKEGTTTVTCTATDRSGNRASTTFTVTREALGFSGFLSPIGGADATGGSFATPLRTFKMGSTVPVKFTATCGGAAILTGTHTLEVIKYSDATTAGTPIDATPQDAATTGNQFRLSSGQWQFNLDTKGTGMSTGIWLLTATLSDSSQHSAWIQLK